jgi:hypothetical protein
MGQSCKPSAPCAETTGAMPVALNRTLLRPLRLLGISAVVRGSAGIGGLWPLGAPLFWVAAFFGRPFSGATSAPCAAKVAGESAFCGKVRSRHPSAFLAHNDEWLRRYAKAGNS